jgi:hypothetical protein
MGKQKLVALFLMTLSVSATSLQSHAKGVKTIAFVPDPSCRASKLVGGVEEALELNLKVKGVKVLKEDKSAAHILLQYFLIVRRDGDRFMVQLDGRAFENRSGKLLAEGSVTSEAFDDDEKGHASAASQAGQLLAESLSVSLGDALWAKGKGRRIMLQITLEESAGSYRQGVVERLKAQLKGMSPRLKGSTPRNLVAVIVSDEKEKDLAEIIAKALVGKDPLQVKWVVRSPSTLILRLVGKTP